MAWRGPTQLGTLGRRVFPSPSEAPLLCAEGGGSESRSSHINVAAMMSKALNAKSGMVLIAALAASAIDVLPAVAGPERLAHVLVSEVTQPPPGWVEFCARQPGECPSTETAPQDVALSRKAWRDLVRVNKWVNETIKPLTDLEHWGVVERWSYPDDGYGDCEDYALLKRRMLIEAGWPREALLLTLVRGADGEGHAVLTVTTDKGDYVLDNQNENVVAWTETGYRFVKRQSQRDPNVWVSLGDSRPAVATASAREH
jgi:predicted transglutaminase-like cysteine proteinase